MRILGLSSTRSDYDLMSSLYKKIHNDDFFDFGIVIAGTHLTPFHDYSINLVLGDNLNVISSVNTLGNSDSNVSQVLSCSLLMSGLVQSIDDFAPDLAFVVGDREDALTFAICLTYLKVPFIHFYGGDHANDGHVDNRVRHAISKLATLHFVSIDEHKERLIALGEDALTIDVVGNLSLDNFMSESFLEKTVLIKKLINIEASKIAFFLYHPMEEELQNLENTFPLMVQLLIEQGYVVICGVPNHDPGHKKVIEIIERALNGESCFSISNVSRNDFVNLLRHTDLVFGNSSSGILEASSFGLPVINLGARQTGRYAPENVVFSDLSIESFSSMLKLVKTERFKENLKKVTNPYGDGNSAARVVALLKELDLANLSLVKPDPKMTGRLSDTRERFKIQ